MSNLPEDQVFTRLFEQAHKRLAGVQIGDKVILSSESSRRVYTILDETEDRKYFYLNTTGWTAAYLIYPIPQDKLGLIIQVIKEYYEGSLSDLLKEEE